MMKKYLFFLTLIFSIGIIGTTFTRPIKNILKKHLNIQIGDSVKIESSTKPGYFLADDESGKSVLAQSGNIEWIVDRQGETGKTLSSETFPKFKNKTTGKYLGGTASGTPLPMGTTDYASGEFWTPVDLSSNDASNINTLITTFHATRYPEQYTYVLYKSLAGNGDGNSFTTPTPAPTGGYQAGYVTGGIVPKINTSIVYDNQVAFVSNGGYILTNVPGYSKTIDDTAKWYIRSVNGGAIAQNYTFNPKTEGLGKVKYFEQWKGAEDNITVTFKAKANADIYVQFAPSINADLSKCVLLNIGGNGNKSTWLGDGNLGNKQLYYPVLTANNTIIDDNKQITDSIPTEGAIFSVMLFGNIVTYKKNDIIIGTWEIPGDSKKLTYLALGGYNSNVEYSDIKIRPAYHPSNFPDTYTSITPKANLDKITLGSKDGKLELWAIDHKHQIYRFNEKEGAPYSMPNKIIDPWKLQELKDGKGTNISGLDDICATCDGNLFGIKSDDKTAVKYDWKKKSWISIKAKNADQIKLEDISASKISEIFATSEDDKIYQLKNNIWVKIADGSSITAGIGTDGKTMVIGLSTSGVPYKHTSGKWIQMGKNIQLNKVTIGHQNYILGINLHDQLVQWNSKTKTWDLMAGKKMERHPGKYKEYVQKNKDTKKQPKDKTKHPQRETPINSVDDIAAIPSGTTVALDKFGNTWHKGTDAVKITTKGITSTKADSTTVTTAVATKKVSTATTKKTAKKVSAKKAAKTSKKVVKASKTKKTIKKAKTPKKTVSKKISKAKKSTK